MEIPYIGAPPPPWPGLLYLCIYLCKVYYSHHLKLSFNGINTCILKDRVVRDQGARFRSLSKTRFLSSLDGRVVNAVVVYC